MNIRTENLLKNLAMQPRMAKFFTHHTAFSGLTEDMLTARLDAVVSAGYATREKGLFSITEAGRAALAAVIEGKKATAKTIGPFSSGDKWTPPTWHTRAGSEAAFRLPSRGLQC